MGAAPGVTQLRSETKYLVDPDEGERIRCAIEAHTPPRMFDGRGPEWEIATVYCDLADRRLLRAAHANPDRNTKIRIRTYRPHDGRGAFDVRRCYVEVKVKNRTLSRKQRFGCDPAEVPALCGGAVPAGLDGESRKVCDDLFTLCGGEPIDPVLIARYRRVAYPAEAAPFRTSIDRGLRISRAAGALDASWWREMPDGDVLHDELRMVVEVKAVGPLPAWLRDAIGPLSPAAFSKVQVGIAKLMDGASG
jgi:hypothetical protein